MAPPRRAATCCGCAMHSWVPESNAQGPPRSPPTWVDTSPCIAQAALSTYEPMCTPHDVRRMSDMKLHRWRSLHACRAPRAQRWTVALAQQQTGFTVLAAVLGGDTSAVRRLARWKGLAPARRSRQKSLNSAQWLRRYDTKRFCTQHCPHAVSTPTCPACTGQTHRGQISLPEHEREQGCPKPQATHVPMHKQLPSSAVPPRVRATQGC